MIPEPIPCENCILFPLCLIKATKRVKYLIGDCTNYCKIATGSIPACDKLADDCKILNTYIKIDKHYSYSKMYKVGIYFVNRIKQKAQNHNGQHTM